MSVFQIFRVFLSYLTQVVSSVKLGDVPCTERDFLKKAILIPIFVNNLIWRYAIVDERGAPTSDLL
mgnify:CR=1 FL=1